MTIGKWQPTDCPVYSTGCVGRRDFEFLKLSRCIIITHRLCSRLKCPQGAEADMFNRRRLKSVCRSLTETHVAIEAVIQPKNVCGSFTETHVAIEAVI
jgi:hypothetical protein